MLALLAFLLAAPQSAAQPTSIQAALQRARAGDTVRIAAGVHRETIRVDKRITIIAEQGAVLDGSGNGSVVTLSADSVVLHGLTVRNSGRSLDRDDAAIKLVRCHGCRVDSATVTKSLHGIYVLESNGAVIAGNTIIGDSTLAEPRRGNGIHLFNSQQALVEGNRVRLSRDGIYFAGSGGALVSDNDVERVRYGLHYMYSDDNRFIRNRFARNAAGAVIMTSKRIRFEANVFVDHVGYRAYGILLQTAEEIVAERNRIEGNLTGIFLDACVGNVFRDNVITGNGVGIDLLASSENNLLAGNIIAHNRTAVRNVLGAGENQWSENGRGNFWQTREVFDLDGDGVGERPYSPSDPFATLAGMRPVLEAFAGTPAARALAWAERAFPVFGLPGITDPAPLAHAPKLIVPDADRPAIAAKPDKGGAARWAALPPLLLAAYGFARRRRSRTNA